MAKFVRVSRSWDEIFDWLDAIEADKKIIYEHEADEEVQRTHIHMYIENPKLKDDALKTSFKKAYNPTDKGNTLWSWKSANVDEVMKIITYMSKGTLVPKFAKGFDIKDIEKATESFQAPKLVDGKFVRVVKEVAKATKREMLEQMRSRMSGTDTTRDILRIVRKVLMSNNEVIGQYKMMDYYDSLYMYERKEDWLYAMERKINSKYTV